MTTPSQLGTLRRKIDGLEAELLETKKALAAARAQEPADIAFLRQQLGDLNKEKIVRLQQENILLQGQASDEEQNIWLPACFAIPWLLGQQVRHKKQQLHQSKEHGHQRKSKKSRDLWELLAKG